MSARRKRPQRSGGQRDNGKRSTTAGAALPDDSSETWLGKHGALIAVLIVMAIAAAIRLRVASVPLERDEGEYAYAGQLILKGIPPYQLAYNMKFPGTSYAYSVILAVFGQTAWGIHAGLLVVNAATTLTVFSLGRKLIGAFGAATAACAFALLSLDRSVYGIFAHATNFVLLPALGGLWLLLYVIDARHDAADPDSRNATGGVAAPDIRRLAAALGAGVLIGVAILMKQQAVFYAPLAVVLLLWGARSLRRTRVALLATILIAGMTMPFAILCGVLAKQGVLSKFWFWTFDYARAYISEHSLADVPSLLANAWVSITRVTMPIWLLGIAGIAALWLGRWTMRSRVVLTGLAIAAFLAVCPGFYFREHYFVLVLPSVALFTGVAIVSLNRACERVMQGRAARALTIALFVVAAGSYVVRERAYLFSMPVRQISREVYQQNPFVEAPEIARYIHDHTTADDRIAVVGSEPEIYFYANRKSATGYIYTYALMEAQPYEARMQREMMDEIETVHPAYIVAVPMPSSMGIAQRSDKTIVNWADRYFQQCYDVVGIADILSMTQTTFLWDDAVKGYDPHSINAVFTLRRKSSAPCAAPR